MLQSYVMRIVIMIQYSEDSKLEKAFALPRSSRNHFCKVCVMLNLFPYRSHALY